MAETSRYKDMSSKDFYSVLKQRELDESWTLSQIVEYERRGSRQFDFDIALVRKLDSFAKKQSEKFAQILAPHKEIYARVIAGSMTQSMRHLLDSVAQQNAKFAVFLPKVEEPNLEFSSNPLAEILSMEPKLADTQLTSPTVQTVIVDGLKEMDQSHFGVLSQIALNTSWGRKEWTLFWLTWVAAVAGIAAAIASVAALFM